MMKSIIRLVALAIPMSSAFASETLISKEYGFIARISGNLEKKVVQSESGPITAYAAVDEKDSVTYRITINDVKATKAGPPIGEELARKLIKAHSESYLEGLGATDIVTKWTSFTASPALGFACTLATKPPGFPTSYRQGYIFLRGGNYFALSLEGIDKRQDLAGMAATFLGTFTFVDQASLEKSEREEEARKAAKSKPEAAGATEKDPTDP